MMGARQLILIEPERGNYLTNPVKSDIWLKYHLCFLLRILIDSSLTYMGQAMICLCYQAVANLEFWVRVCFSKNFIRNSENPLSNSVIRL